MPARLLLFHGTTDRFSDPDGSRWLYAEAPSTDEAMNEPERDRVLDDLTAWVLTCAAPSPSPG